MSAKVPAIVGLACALLPLHAMAEQPPANGIQEVVVTARKRVENLQDTPISITALTSDVLASRGIDNLAGIAESTPSLVFNTNAPQSGNAGSASVFMRGVGQLDFTMFTDPGVGIYVDGVYMARSVGSVLDFIDVDRVEILRGPQGTLFGRNTIGGAINVVSALPADKWGGRVAFTTGSDSRAQLQGTLDAPLSETFLTQWSVFAHVRDGYVRRLQTGEDLGNDDAVAARAHFVWRPYDDFSARLVLDDTRKREHPGPVVRVAASPFGYTGGLDNTPPTPIQGPVPPFPPGSLAALFNGAVLGGNCRTALSSPTNPNTTQACWGTAWSTNDPYATNSTLPGGSELDTRGAALTLDWTLAGTTLKSITAYRTLAASYVRDVDQSPFEYISIDYDDDENELSQEFQLTGAVFDQRLKWLLGVFYFKEDGDEIFVQRNAAAVSSTSFITLGDENYAVFTENTFDVTPRFHVTAGVRWTHETKSLGVFQPVTATRTPGSPALGFLVVTDPSVHEQSFERTTPRATLAYDLADDLMTYVTYSEGFKSGGFNGRYALNPGNVPFAAPVPFDPEVLKQWELGIKYQNGFLRLNAAAFHSDYDNMQVNFRPPGSLLLTAIGNAAQGEIQGGEVELNLSPWRGLSIDGGISYIDAHYVELGPTVSGITLQTPFVDTPEWSGSLSMSYRFNFDNGAKLTPRVDYSYRSEVALTNDDAYFVHQDDLSLVNASIIYQSPSDAWRFALGGRNLTDERYLVSGGFSANVGNSEGTYARPREWYLNVSRTF
jgi:iron complex outermembrane receptor protein